MGERTNIKFEVSHQYFAFSITVIIIFWFLWALNKPKKGTLRLPPGPRGLPVLGYLPFLRANAHHSFAELAQIHGPVFSIWLGSKLCVVFSSPSVIKEVVRDQDLTFANRDLMIAGLVFSNGGNDIALAPIGSNWRFLRKIFATHLLSDSNLDVFYRLRRHEIRKTITDVYSNRVGAAVDFGELSFAAVFNSTTSMLWGGELDGDKWSGLAAEFRAAISKLSVLLSKPNVSDFFPALEMLDLQRIERDTKKVLMWIEHIFDVVLDEGMKMESANQKGFLQVLHELKREQEGTTGGGSITIKQIKGLLVDVMVGGTDTTSTTVEWAMAEMIKNPNTMRNAYDELTSVVGLNNIVEESHVPKLPYLDAILKETLRLHPPIPFLIPRSPTRTSAVGGYHIPRGTKVFLNVWGMHRDPDFWDLPLEFKPERFLSNNERVDFSGNNFKYLPFGSGRRICAGLPLAERTMPYLLASFLHSFKWKLPPGLGLDLSDKLGVSTKKSTPLIVVPTPRLSNLELYS